jgi:transcriptional regulator with XRE-family HTH domain
MNIKLRELRVYLKLSETHISSLLNISSYKYKRFEKGELPVPVEIILLLSIMYNIPFDYIICDKYDVSDLIKIFIKNNFLFQENATPTKILENNIIHHPYSIGTVINQKMIKAILCFYIENFSNNLIILRKNKNLEIQKIADKLSIDLEHYSALEKGVSWPNIFELLKIANSFNVHPQDLFIEKR